MASIANIVSFRSLVKIRSRVSSLQCNRSALIKPLSNRYLSTQAAASPASTLKARPALTNAVNSTAKPLQPRLASTMSLQKSEQDWRILFRKAYYGSLYHETALFKKQLPQPSHIPSPEKSPIYAAWTHPLLIWGIVALNGAVLLLFTYAENLYKQGDSRLVRFMVTHVRANYCNGNWWTLVTDCFFHGNIYEYGFNMLNFIYIAPPMITLLGPMTFLGVYIGAGMAAGIASNAWNKSEYRRNYVASQQVPQTEAEADQSSGSAETIAYRGCGPIAANIALASILAMIDSRSKMLFLVFPVYTRLYLPVVSLAPVLLFLVPTTDTGYNVTMDPSFNVAAVLYGLLYWRIGLRGKQFV